MSLVVVEGTDYTGKSTLVHALAERDGIVSVSTPSAELRRLKDYVHSVLPHNARMYFYLMSALLTSELAKNSEGVVVSDRYWYTTVVYESVLSKVPMDRLRQDHSQILTCLERPVVTIYLTISPEEMTRRIQQRGVSGLSDRLMLQPEERSQILRNYERFAKEFGWYAVDANASIDKVVADVFGIIEQNHKIRR